MRHPILSDFAGLGVKLVLAVGTQHQVDTQLKAEGAEPQYVGGYRVRPTDPDPFPFPFSNPGPPFSTRMLLSAVL